MSADIITLLIWAVVVLMAIAFLATVFIIEPMQERKHDREHNRSWLEEQAGRSQHQEERAGGRVSIWFIVLIAAVILCVLLARLA